MVIRAPGGGLRLITPQEGAAQEAKAPETQQEEKKEEAEKKAEVPVQAPVQQEQVAPAQPEQVAPEAQNVPGEASRD